MNKTLVNIFCLWSLLISWTLRAQSLVDDANVNIDSTTPTGVFSETIKIISNSKKIFVITNNNQQLTPGDFISLALGGSLAARALVAKTHQGQAGIKIMKIYSLAQWGKLHRNMEVQIIRGDDTGFGKTAPTTTEEGTAPRIRSEEDLYTDEVVARDDIDIEESTNRFIKPDNVISISGSYLTASRPQYVGGAGRGTEVGFGWAYQFRDNIFAEGIYGRTLLSQFPAEGASTLVNRLVGRIKYNIQGPAYTFFMPYVGFQSTTTSSPDAGKGDTDDDEAQEELDAVAALEKTGLVLGVTVMRRLVPGWFIKADLGTDLINVGFAVEF